MLGQALDGMTSADVDWRVQALQLAQGQHYKLAPVAQSGRSQEDRVGPAPARGADDASSSQGARPVWTDNMLSDAGAGRVFACPEVLLCSCSSRAPLRRARHGVGLAARARAAAGIRESAGAGVCRAGLQLL